MSVIPMPGKARREDVSLRSGGEQIKGVLFQPDGPTAVPAIIIAHGAGEFKENYFELCEFLAGKGIASLALDMHGHGESEGNRFHVKIDDWVADVRAAIDYLSSHPQIDHDGIGAFGLSSGGTAILEAALVDSRLRFLVPLDATVRNSMPLPLTAIFKGFVTLGTWKKRWTGKEFRLPMVKVLSLMKLASDPNIDRALHTNPRARVQFFPLPGAEESFLVDTIKRVGDIKVPTLVVWGEDDQIDSPKTARMLFDALRCKKELHIIPGNGHMGHLDRNREQVFSLTAAWTLQNIHSNTVVPARAVS